MSLSTNTTYRVYVEKIGASDPAEFIGDAGEIFYDPNTPTLKLSDGSTPGGLTIAGGGGGGESYWVSGASGISTSSNVGIGTTNPQYKLHVSGAGTTALFVEGDVRIVGILSVGTGTITLDPANNSIAIGTAITLNATTGTIEVQGSTIANPTGDANYTGIVTAAYFYGDGSNLTNVAGGSGAFSYCCTSNITSTNLTSHPDITSANNNFFAGCGAGCSITSGVYNNFLGYQAGYNNTTGSYNNFFGLYAGKSNTTGSYNNFFGCNAGSNNQTSCFNTFIGDSAGQFTTTGCNNSFFGANSGVLNTEGNYNIFLGKNAGRYNTTGNCNVFIGNYSGISASASNKIILGSSSGFGNGLFDSPDTDKDTQFAVGVRTDANPSNYWIVGNENFNIGIGTTNPQYKLDVGGDVNFSGTLYQNGVAFSGGGSGAFSYCCTSNITSTNLTSHPDITSANNNFFVGCNAGYYITTGFGNNFIGKESGYHNTTGCCNNFFGGYSGCCNTAGCYNSFFGTSSGSFNEIGNYNSFFGAYTGYRNTTGSLNTFVGFYVGESTTASHKVLIGSAIGGTGDAFDAPDTTKDTQFAVGVKTDANPANYWLVGIENFNIGIGTTNPLAKLHVGGDVKVGINTSQGVILTSPNGTAYRLIVNDAGVLSTVAV